MSAALRRFARLLGQHRLYIDGGPVKGGPALYGITKIKVVPVPERSMLKVFLRGKGTWAGRYYEILPVESQLAMTLVFDSPAAASGLCVTETLSCASGPTGADCT